MLIYLYWQSGDDEEGRLLKSNKLLCFEERDPLFKGNSHSKPGFLFKKRYAGVSVCTQPLLYEPRYGIQHVDHVGSCRILY